VSRRVGDSAVDTGLLKFGVLNVVAVAFFGLLFDAPPAV
jgi:hypothetical protein